MFIRIKTLLLGTLIGMMLSSCGGDSGDSSGGNTQRAEGGIGGTGISSGSITAIGSIYVNGIKFSTAGAKFVEEDDDDGAITFNTDDSDDTIELAQYLSEGMVVTVTGTIDNDSKTGIAKTISFEDMLEGPVVGTPAANATSFTAFGQTVNVTASTKYDDGLTKIDDIKDGQVVEISGYRDANGEIHAAYVTKKEDTFSTSREYEIKGVATVNSQYELQIGGLKISTSGRGQDVTGFAEKFVEAKGLFNGTDTLTALEDVEAEDESFDESDSTLDGYKAELEGLALTACGSAAPCEFELNGVTVQVETNTTYSGGSSGASAITKGVKLEAEGKLQNGKLVADSIEFK